MHVLKLLFLRPQPSCVLLLARGSSAKASYGYGDVFQVTSSTRTLTLRIVACRLIGVMRARLSWAVRVGYWAHSVCDLHRA
jgi:hypothetical protein